MVADKFLAAELKWFFEEPLHYRDPTNTEAKFKEYIKDPTKYKNWKLSNEYLAIRYTDLRNEMDKIKREGDTRTNERKWFFYYGAVTLLKEMLMNIAITPKEEAEQK